MDFPDRGDEISPPVGQLVDQFEAILKRATEKRLRADVPVVSYLSGGVDSSTVVALASAERGEPIPSFTVRVRAKGLDESAEADLVARHVGSRPFVIDCGHDEILNTYPQLIRAAEGPVVDTAASALLLLAGEVHRQGYKAALTGEGADEWLAGYSWYKVSKLLGMLDLPGLKVSNALRWLFVKLSGAPPFPWSQAQRVWDAAGGHNPWLELWSLMSMSKLRLYSKDMWAAIGDRLPYDDLNLDKERMRRWHPLNRGVFYAGRVHLAGLLLNGKGDRVAMNSSVETRYPFLDEDVFNFLAPLSPSLKLRRLRDKYILRKTAERWLPKKIAWRRKAMFLAPFDSFHLEHAPAYVQQLMSEEALRKTGCFDPAAVAHWRQAYRTLGRSQRISTEMGLAAVFSTQLWHQIYIDNSLADVPGSVVGDATARPAAALSTVS
jgi:asparagine synthase (glutamine-hydrolysing)